MNEKLQYAEMLEIPVNTCNITYKHTAKKSRKKKKGEMPEQAKEMLIEKVNAEEPEEVFMQGEQPLDEGSQIENEQVVDEVQQETALETEQSQQNYVAVRRTDKVKKKRKFKFSIIGIEVVAIFALIATILITNALVPNSAINTIMNGTFGQGSTVTKVDERIYSQFSPILPVESTDGVIVERGVMSFTRGGSLYSPCDGKITGLVKDVDGSYTVEITHSQNFKTVFSGVDYAYCADGDKVYSNIPVGYITDGATMCFYDGSNGAITDYTIEQNAVKWEV